MKNKYTQTVSVVITTYKRPHFLWEALESIKAQTYTSIEVIVVDDGSSAFTRDVVTKWRTQMPETFSLQYIWQCNSGPASARNRGLSIATGEFALFMDDDDFMDSHCIAHLVDALHKEKGPAVAMGSYANYIRGQTSREVSPPTALSYDEILSSMIGGSWFIPIHGYLFNRQAIEILGPWDTNLTSQEDDDYLLDAAYKGVKFLPSDMAVVFYRQHSGTRRATPGTPDETVSAGRKKRLVADIAIREKIFRKLKTADLHTRFYPSFRVWFKRLQERYHDLLPMHPLSGEMFKWIDVDTRDILHLNNELMLFEKYLPNRMTDTGRLLENSFLDTALRDDSQRHSSEAVLQQATR